jgi:hypothetical protein
MSAESSGGVFSRVVLIASIIVASGSARASLTSAEEIVISLGSPSTRFLPLTTRFFSSSPGYAEPIFILMSSAVLSPMRRLYFLLT